jgi:hypothetical protein
MRALEIWKAVTVDETDFLERFIGLMEEHEIRFCVIEGQGINAYAEPFVSLDLDVVVAVEDLQRTREIAASHFKVEAFPNSIYLTSARSNLRIQIQTDPRYFDFVHRAQPAIVLGVKLPIAAGEDVLQGKNWAAMDETRRGTKRQNDLADINRLIESHPDLRRHVPAEILDRLL